MVLLLQYTLTFASVLILVALVQGVQMAGDSLVRRLAHRR